MKYIKSIKTILALLIIFIVSLAIILLDKSQYSTISEIKAHTYILFAIMILSFYGFFTLIYVKTDKNPAQVVTKTDKIINIIYVIVIFLTSLAIGFGLMLISAYIEPIADTSSAEEINRYIEQYKIILLGRNVIIYTKLTFIIITGLRFAYFSIKDKKKNNEISTTEHSNNLQK